ncbi:MAG: SGNH/GDSL hydrolase family protein [Candidatus Omnitrophica bacterium]|nr:SGNH/GDSL hydrolase family protein [Candidatus Omnitrophota bacterium]
MSKINSLIRVLWHSYHFIAVALLNTVVALILLNVILSVMFQIKDHFSPDPVSTKYGDSIINAVYPGLSDSEIQELLKETWSRRRYIYEPFTQFKESPHQGVYVNVDINGFRLTKNQGPWPPQPNSFNIFLFGGSTTFGYGVQDDQTIASHLQEYLAARLKRDVRVYNFARGHYYSTQERILYEQLLTSGSVPDMAIFIDGLNDFYFNSNEPGFTSRFRDFMDKGITNNKTNNKGFIAATSIGRAVKGVQNRLWKEKTELDTYKHDFSDPQIFTSVIQTYLMNKKIIEAVSKPFGVKPIFVWQPIPTYHYDLQYHPFSKKGFGKHSYSQYGYEHMHKLIEGNPLGDNFLWCADIQKDENKPLYVDIAHYSSDFSAKFAMAIGNLLIERSLLKVNVSNSD